MYIIYNIIIESTHIIRYTIKVEDMHQYFQWLPLIYVFTETFTDYTFFLYLIFLDR